MREKQRSREIDSLLFFDPITFSVGHRIRPKETTFLIVRLWLGLRTTLCMQCARHTPATERAETSFSEANSIVCQWATISVHRIAV